MPVMADEPIVMSPGGLSGTTLIDATVTVTPHWTTTYGWTIAKSVDVDSFTLYPGDQGISTYTVTLTKDAGTTKAWVDGQICVTNGGAVDTQGLAITAEVLYNAKDGNGYQHVTDATVDVSGNPVLSTGPYNSVTGYYDGERGCYNYKVDIPSPVAEGDYKVTAHITITNHSGHLGVPFGPDPSATTTFLSTPTLVDNCVNVADTFGSPWTNICVSGSLPTYTKTFTDSVAYCDKDNLNTATFTTVDTGTTGSASASVHVTCLTAAGFSKTADTDWDKLYTWKISKLADKTEMTLASGESQDVKYTVSVDKLSVTPQNFIVSGTITMTNNFADRDITINTLTDEVPSGETVTIDGFVADTVLGHGETKSWTYSATLTAKTGGTNTATAGITYETFTFSAGEPESLGDQSFSIDATHDYAFSATPTNLIDECVTVTDSYGGTLGTACIGNTLPKDFTYIRTIAASEFTTCGDKKVDNTATFTTIDTSATGSAKWTVTVHIPCGGCTLTPGYWMTHSINGPAAHPDATWNKLPPLPSAGPNTQYYSSGQNYLKVLQTAPTSGNVYYILSFQYIAAKLNILAGASTTPAINAAMVRSNTFFTTYTPTTAGALKANSAARAQAIADATLLTAYNQGIATGGPGHCSE